MRDTEKMATITGMTERISVLADSLRTDANSLQMAPTISVARQICMSARSLFSGFEEEAIWDQEIKNSNRKTTLEALEHAKEMLNDIGKTIPCVDRSKYVKIQCSMAQRIELTRFSTISTIRERLEEFAVELRRVK